MFASHARARHAKRRRALPLLFLIAACLAVTFAFFPSARHASADSYPNCPTLSSGSTGGCVTRLQQDLDRLNGANLAADGKFGPKTRQAVIDFQRNYGLTRDGAVGEKTAQTLSNLAGHGLPFGQPSPANYPPTFDPAKAGTWARDNAQSYKSSYTKDPCTEFASRALAVGGMPQNDAWWDPADPVNRYMNPTGTSGPWVNVEKAAQYWVGRGWAREIPLDAANPNAAVMARPGDLLFFKWGGSDKTHMAMVTGVNGAVALKSEQNGGATPPFSRDGQWNLSYSHGQKPVAQVYKGIQATLLHWNEQPQ
ncbi:amidase domain-containing protein [Streptomyces sp. NBC_00988]|uniref:peptidoglycan-binding protein n=1 Tax=Streptomyces sp. NBC_00988 TaxID=2903704 RepID=UPI003869A79C|nr:amidase domain-containing protein [Streptomyces sp. NBC_00988]